MSKDKYRWKSIPCREKSGKNGPEAEAHLKGQEDCQEAKSACRTQGRRASDEL